MRWLSALTWLVFVAPAAAEPATLANEALRQLATGKTVHLESPYGTLPVTFKEDGTLAGKASGALALYLGSTTDRGRWSVKGDRICQKFFKWFAGETHCMRVKMDGRRITWRRDDGLTGTATIAANDAPLPERPIGLGVRPGALTSAARAGAMSAPEAPVSTELVSSEQIPSEPVLPEAEWTTQTLQKMTPRPMLASLHVAPKGMSTISGRPEAAEPAPSAEQLVPQTSARDPFDSANFAISRFDIVEDVLRKRVTLLWCLNHDLHKDVGSDNAYLGGQAASREKTGMTRPFIFEAAHSTSGTLDVGHELEGATGCLMATPLLPEIARLALPAR